MCRQDQEMRRMTVELEAAISDRDSLKKSHQVLGEKLKAELTLTRAKYALCRVLLQYILGLLSSTGLSDGIVSTCHVV